MICNNCGKVCGNNDKFCQSCGNNLQQYINQYNTIPNNQYYNVNNYNQINSNKKSNITLYICCFIVLVTLVVIVTLIASRDRNTVYFNDENQDTVTNENVVTSNKHSDYTTVIDPKHVYYMTVENDVEAYNKIKEDSNNQKNTCSKNIVAIEERISNNYGITGVNLCEMDEDYAKETELVIKNIYDNYPNARGYLTNISLINTSMSDNYIACFMPFLSFLIPEDGSYPITNKTSIFLNASYFLNSEYMVKIMKNSSSTGHFPPNATRTSSVAHEFGHYLSFVTILKKYNIDSILIMKANNYGDIYKIYEEFVNGTNSLNIIEEAYKNYKSKYNDNNLSFDDFRASISKYAVAKNNEGKYIYDETIAEAFHDYYLNGTHAKPASLEIVSVLKSRLG